MYETVKWTLVYFLITIACVASQTITDFTQPANIHEDTIAETRLTRIECTPATGDTNCLCNVQTIAPNNGPFSVFKKNGDVDFYVYYLGVANGARLDITTDPTYLVTVECFNEARTTSDTADLEIDVQQNQAPEFTNANYPTETLTLDAMTPVEAGTTVYTLTANDDETDPFTFSITSVPDVGYFEVAQATGIITTTIDLRAATVDNIVLTASVTDGTHTIDDFDIFITIDNLNDRPVIENLPATVTIPETTTGGFQLITLTFTDV
ncbi:protocadherin Fat 4 [Elysia marginata]|uniref:Protocadherin Fat 4 n=1 Tax=Elysia marginata TaxID=1093978 RepID=A0AAV4FIG3_9GAST|nr:protocadherin Fat 4 [Elysia marginata]